MNEAAIRKSLEELSRAVKSCQSGKIAQEDETYEPLSGPPKEITVDERLAELQLRVKYLVFDLEATRRENGYLREMLEMRRRRRKDQQDDSGPFEQ